MLSSDEQKANVSSSTSSLLSESKLSKSTLPTSEEGHDLRETLEEDYDAVKQKMRDTSDRFSKKLGSKSYTDLLDLFLGVDPAMSG